MKKIQIALVSKETLPVFYMINELRPDEVYLVGTKETQNEMHYIKAVAKSIGVVCHELTTQPDSMQDCMRVCDSVHARNVEGDCEYCYNLTCGTKLMAFGALICAQSHKANAVYTDVSSYTDFSDFERHDITKLLSTGTMIALQGQKVKAKEIYHYDAERTECANEVRNFIENHPKEYKVLMTNYIDYKYLPNPFRVGKLLYYRDGGRLVVEYDDVEVFSSDYKDAFKMLLEGRWWETLVANVVAKWAGEDREVWTNVRFEPNAKTQRNDKNEIDVLVNIGNALLFVECKSGSFTQDNIYKLSSVFKTYGSYKSRGVIVSYRSNVIKPDLEEKAKEERVSLLVPNRSMADLFVKLDKVVNTLKS